MQMIYQSRNSADNIRISVVIATRDRAAAIRKVAGEVLAQLQDRDELIVVDDGTEAGPSYDWLPANARLLRSHGRGPAVARNMGWRAAVGAVVAFTDDDVHLGSGWLEAVRAEFSAADDLAAVEGRTVTRPFDRLYEYSVSSDTARTGLTCNVAYRRSVLERERGFDEGFGFAHCEDFDLFTRARAVGDVVFCERMRVEHQPRAITPVAFARRGGWLASERRLYAKHPELKRYPLSPAVCATIDYLRWPLDTLLASSDARTFEGPRRVGRALLISGLWWCNALRAASIMLWADRR
ncbi:MAG: glycosyltransferase family 2 protein [Solirubrobacteraceae bacterium]